MDFTPRYLREDDSGSWLSEGSAAATVEVHSDQGRLLLAMINENGDDHTIFKISVPIPTVSPRLQWDSALWLLTRRGDDHQRRWKQQYRNGGHDGGGGRRQGQ